MRQTTAPAATAGLKVTANIHPLPPHPDPPSLSNSTSADQGDLECHP